jgi:hypothetical protein
MFGMLIVSICGVALPIATGFWLAPAHGEQDHAGAADRQSAAAAGHSAAGNSIDPARGRGRRAQTALVRPGRFAGTAPAPSHFCSNLAS